MSLHKSFRIGITVFLTIVLLLESFPLSVLALYIGDMYTFITSVEKEDEIPDGYTAIYSVADLKAIRNAPAGKYILMEDIDLSSDTSWLPLYTFNGVLDGNGHILSNIQYTISGGTAQTMTGLWEINTGTIKDLGVKNYTVTADTTSGVLYGSGLVAVNQGTIENCYVSGTLEIEVQSPSITVVGALCAFNTSAGTVSGCHSLCTITVLSQKESATQLECGGVVGENKGTVKNCVYSSSTLRVVNENGISLVGGIVGHTLTSLQDCGNLGNLSVETTGNATVGGITALLDGDFRVDRSYNYGNIEVCSDTGDGYGGGIVGLATVGEGTTTSSQNYNEGSVTVKINSSSANGAAGGIAGVLQGYYHIKNSYNNGTICVESTGENASAGGIVGNFILNIAYGTIENTYNTGKIESSMETKAGGLVGTYSYSYVVIKDSVKNSYSINHDSLIGSGSPVAVIADTCKNYNDNAAAMESASTYSGFDFTNVWTMEEGYAYPSLQNNPRIVLIPDIKSERNILQYRADSISSGGKYDIGHISLYHDYALTTKAGACVDVIETLGAGAQVVNGLWEIIENTVNTITTGVPYLITERLEEKDIYGAILLDMLECESDKTMYVKEYSNNAILKHTMKLTELLKDYLQKEHDLSDEAMYYTWLKTNANTAVDDMRVCITTYVQDKSNACDYLTISLKEADNFNGNIKKLLENAGSIENMMSQYISYSMLYNLSESTKNAMRLMLKSCDDGTEPALKDALEEIIDIFDQKSEEALKLYCLKEYNVEMGKDELIDGIKWLYKRTVWKKFMEGVKATHPYMAYAYTIYNTGKYIADETFDTSAKVEAYYKMYAVLDIEDLMIKTLVKAYNDYIDKKNNANAAALLDILELRAKITKIDIKMAEKYMDVADWDESWEDYIATKKDTTNELHFQLNTGWLVQLQEEDPDSVASYTGYWIDAWRSCLGRYPEYFLDNSVVVLENRCAEAECIEIACPVQVHIYDEEGNIAAYVSDGTVYTSGDIAVLQQNEHKLFYISDMKKYTIVCTGYDTGVMDVSLTHYADTNVTRHTAFYDIVVEKGNTYTMAFSMEDRLEQESVFENGSAETISPQYDTRYTSVEKNICHVKNGYIAVGERIGDSVELCAYESVELTPIIPDGYRFLRWSSTVGEGVFEDANDMCTRLIMPAGTITIEAIMEPTKAKVPVLENIFPENLVYAVGDIIEELSADATNQNPEGVLTYAWYSSTTNDIENGVLVGMRSSYIPPTDVAGVLYYFVVVTNTVQTSNGEMTAYVTSTPIKVTVWMRGDVNTDGSVDIADSQLLSAYFSGYSVEIASKTADMDQDGYLTRRDAMILARHVAGWTGYDILPYKQ